MGAPYGPMRDIELWRARCPRTFAGVQPTSRKRALAVWLWTRAHPGQLCDPLLDLAELARL
jgi:hypothetical protein